MDETPTPFYHRPKGDTALAISFVRNDTDAEGPPDSEILKTLRHGDLVYEAEGYRGTDTWVVLQGADDAKRFEATSDGAGYCEISIEVSELVEDPLSFYAGVTDDSLYQGVTTINFDPTAHQTYLRTLTGGRPIHESRRLWWASYNGCVEIAVPPSPDHPRGDSAELNEDTPAEYLGDAESLEEDPLTKKARETNRVLFEETAPAIFAEMKEGDSLSLTNLPTEVDGGCHGAGARFVSFADGELRVRVVPEGVVTFRLRRVELENGPLAGVRVWAADNPGYGMPRVWMISAFGLRGDEKE